MLAHTQKCASSTSMQACPTTALAHTRPAVSHLPSAVNSSRRHQLRRRAPVVFAQNESFGDSVAKMAKKIQGQLPIVGLLSRLASPEGGFDDLAYPEYSRSIIEKSSDEMMRGIDDLEKRYGKVASMKFVLLLIWMAKSGLGWVPAKDIIGAARRMRVTQDIEIEIDRIDIAKSEKKAKYDMIAPPETPIQEQVTVAVDGICTLCFGLKDGMPVKEEDAPCLISIVQQGLAPEATKEMVSNAIASRPERATAYA